MTRNGIEGYKPHSSVHKLAVGVGGIYQVEADTDGYTKAGFSTNLGVGLGVRYGASLNLVNRK